MANGQDGTLTKPAAFYRIVVGIQKQFKDYNTSLAEKLADLELRAAELMDTDESITRLLESIKNDVDSPAHELLPQQVITDHAAFVPVDLPTQRYTNVATVCGHLLDSAEPIGAELCIDCLRAKIKELAPVLNPVQAGVAPPSWSTRKAVTPQTVKSVKAQQSQCVHGFAPADCSICNLPESVGF